MNTKDMRKYPRKAYRFKVGLNTEHNFYVGFSGNISEGGLFVASEAPLEIGDKVSLKFKLPNFPDEIQVEGEVRWVRDAAAASPGAPAGMGIKFLSLDPHVQQAIENFVAQRDPEFYPDED